MFPFPQLPAARLTPLFLLLTLGICSTADPISVNVPSVAPNHNVVQSNFLGISFELSFMDEYCAFNRFLLFQTLTLLSR